MSRVLHITPHLGGGVGKAVSGLIRQSTRSGHHQHIVLCLEKPEKTQFTDLLEEAGCPPRYGPSLAELIAEVRSADIVQVEFWNHPAIVKALCTAPLPPMRLLVWCHVSGLHYPQVPWGLVENAGRFLFTSACSLALTQRRPPVSNVDVVSSGGGMDEMPPCRPRPTGQRLAAGYIGTLNFSKLHPDFVSFAAAVQTPGFRVRMIGDEINRDTLEEQSRLLQRPDLLQFYGYRTNIAAELAELDLFIYLLNPTHYGTAENTLLEAMAMGVVPVVMDNAAERHIVEDGRTGRIVKDPRELANVVDWLARHDAERLRMGQTAAAAVRDRHTYARMSASFDTHYRSLLEEPKRAIAFPSVFGKGPADWFMAFQPGDSAFTRDGEVAVPDDMRRHALLERTKGSVFHFLDYFPEDAMLSSWAEKLRKYL